MPSVVGVRFQEAGKIYYFEAAGYDDLEAGEFVVVETSRGQELARVIIAPGQVLEAELTEPLKPISRVATDADIDRAEQLKRKADQDVDQARQQARAAKLPMKIVSGSFSLDGDRLTLFFTSEERIDFRDLIRDLSHKLGTQVLLRQIGPRDQAKIVGGYGLCGRQLCCTSWLINFPPISIKMAKEQDLPLNPSKISGQCGRLLCCLSYENDMYRQVKQALPRPGAYLSTPTGNARVLSVNVPREVITLQMETAEIVEIAVQDLGFDRGLVRVLEARPEPRQAETETRTAVPVPARGSTRPPRRERPGPPIAQIPITADLAPARPPQSTGTPDAGPQQEAQPPRPGTRRRRRRRGNAGTRSQPPGA